MEIKKGFIKLDIATKEINIYLEGQKALIENVSVDKLNRVYIKILR